jgi:hypothetical protein
VSPPDPVDLGDVNKLTPRALLAVLRRLTLGSWLLLLGLIGAGLAGAFGFGVGYQTGTLPGFSYALHPTSPTPAQRRVARDAEADFAAAYSDFVDWQTLRAISANVAMKQPDGLDGPFEIAASLLAQVRATRGYAAFLSGDEQIAVTIKRTPDGFELEWNESSSILRRIAQDAGYTLSDEDVVLHNSNLNWAQFTYLDDAMERAVIYRDLDGDFGLVIRE